MGIFNSIFNFFKKENGGTGRPDYVKKQETVIDPPRFVPMQPPRTAKYISKIKHTVYYVDGHISKISPEPTGRYYDNRNIIYEATYIVSDGVPYDLSDIQSVLSIKIPNFHAAAQTALRNEMGVTGCLDYVLRSRAAHFYNEEEFDLCFACLWKATVLMKYSTILWSENDYYRIVNWLVQLGRFKKAKEWQDWIEQSVLNRDDMQEMIDDRTTSLCETLKTDLVIVDYVGACCEKCAMYRNRIYSLKGKDRRFPRFPKDFHSGCGLAVFPFVWGLDEPDFDGRDPIKYSNRPFVDDRTQEELKNMEKRIQDAEKASGLQPVSLAKITYYRLKQLFPDDVPKSLSAFSRARNANTPKYQALVKKAEAAGFVFPQSLDDAAKWEDEDERRAAQKP